ncbi:MAG: TonB-dependent receptor [Flavobacterium sp.]
MTFYRFLLPLLVAGSWCAQAQHTLRGTVTSAQQVPLEGAHIHIDSLHAVASPDGGYELHSIATGSHRVVISYLSYKSLDTVMAFDSDKILNAVLQPESLKLEEVQVAVRNPEKEARHDSRIKQEILERYSNATVGDALREVAGTYTLRTGSSIVKPVINGMHSSRVPVFNGGIRLEDQQWGTEHAPNLDINAAQRLSVIKGAAALQYSGDAVGGVVLAEPFRVVQDTLFGRTILTGDSNGRGGSITSSLHKGAVQGWAWNAAGIFKYMGDRQAPDYVLSNTGNREANFAGDVAYRRENDEFTIGYSLYNTTIGIAKATHTGSMADLVRAINSREPSVIEPFTHNIEAPRQEVLHHTLKAGYTHKSDNTETVIQYAFQLNDRKEYDLRRGQYEDTPALDLTLTTHSLTGHWKKELESGTIMFGANGITQRNTASPDTGIRPLIPNYSRYDAGAFGMYTHRFSATLLAEAGLRYDLSHVNATKFYQKSRWDALGYNDGSFDYIITGDFGTQWRTNPKFDYHNVSASLGIRKTLENGLQLLGNAGLAVRNPNPSELFSDGLHHSTGTIELGDLRIGKEKAVKLSATILDNEGDFTFSAMPYANIINGYIFLQPTGAEYTVRGSFPVYAYRQTDALLAGLDVQAAWQVCNAFRYSFTGAYIYGQDTKDDLPLVDMPPLNISNAIRYTSSWKNLYAELRSETVFRQNRYPNNNFFTDVPVDGELVPVLTDVSTPPAGYHLLHFTSGLQFKIAGVQSAVSFSVHNIFNTSYRDYLNRQRLYLDEAGRNFQLQLKLNY